MLSDIEIFKMAKFVFFKKALPFHDFINGKATVYLLCLVGLGVHGVGLVHVHIF